MADLKKFLDQSGVSVLWSRIAEEVAKVDEKVVTNADEIAKHETRLATAESKIEALEKGTYDDTEVRGLISGLETNKADKTQVATDIAAAVKAEKEAREAAVSGVQGAVDTLSGTHATDKKALEDAIALKASQTALDEVSAVANAAVKQSDYDTKVKALEDEDARIEGLVTAEAERAAGVEAGLDERLVEVEAFFKLAEGEQLDTAMDTLVEIQKYITDDGAAADAMVKDIAANKKAIEDHVATDHDFATADAALKSELMGEINKKADEVHSHDDLYYTEAEIDALIAGIPSDIFLVTVTQNEDGTHSADKTYAEIVEAFNSGKLPICVKDNVIHQFVSYGSTGLGEHCQFVKATIGNQGAITSLILIQGNGSVGVNTGKFDINQITNVLRVNELNTTNKTITGAINELVGSVETLMGDGEGSVADMIADAKQEAINAATTAETNAKAHADGLNTAMNTRVATLEAIDHTKFEAAGAAAQALIDAKSYVDTEINTKIIALSTAEIDAAIAAAKTKA